MAWANLLARGRRIVASDVRCRGPWHGVAMGVLLTSFVVGVCDVARAEVGGRLAEVPSDVRVTLKVRTGGTITGTVIDHTTHGLVVVRGTTPYVFAWHELIPGSAFVARRAILIGERGGVEHFSADDHFKLGKFALHHERRDLAVDEFRAASQMDESFDRLIAKAYADLRDIVTSPKLTPVDDDPDEAAAERTADVDPSSVEPLADVPSSRVAALPSSDVREKVLTAYRTFGAEVQKVLGRSIVLVESEHFLIWTDWAAPNRKRLPEWFEAMYDALVEQFALAPEEPVFLAKCPVFCFRGKKRYERFARHFDGHDSVNSVGYTRSIEGAGHVHIALLRVGRSETDFDLFASTLVHEGTHAFLHRLFATRLIPHWVNEGLAELVAERVLGDRCPTGENAELLAQQFVRKGWSIADLLASSGPIEVQEYAVAHSVVRFLEMAGRERFAGFVRDLKGGMTLPGALGDNYDGLTLRRLESDWRASVNRASAAIKSSPRSATP